MKLLDKTSNFTYKQLLLRWVIIFNLFADRGKYDKKCMAFPGWLLKFRFIYGLSKNRYE